MTSTRIIISALVVIVAGFFTLPFVMAKSGNSDQTAGDQYLMENAKKEGVVTLPSGLEYKIIKAGSEGPHPKLSDDVTVHYEGRLVNGKIFDSSYQRGEPATFPVSGVIKGWTEALQLMTPGSVWELTIPSKLAYGERGAGGLIGPNETLIFNVELLKVN
jgi:FKBP-type peptidyl-prolyl cis-trans isomerase FklB